MQIGRASVELDLSPDTLRYYEKIGLLPGVSRSSAGTRSYTVTDISRVRFIKRAKRMGFRLSEISQLLEFRDQPARVKPRVRQLAGQRLEEVKVQLSELQQLKEELQSLIGVCEGNVGQCPILQEIDDASEKSG